MSLNRIKKSARTPFHSGQFYLVEVNPGFYNFIDRKSLIIISCAPFDMIRDCIANVLRRYKNYDLLQLNINKLQFTAYTLEEKRAKQDLLTHRGEQLNYVLDELITDYHHSKKTIKTDRPILTQTHTTAPEPLLVESSTKKRPTAPTDPTPIKPLSLKKRTKRL